MNLKPVSFKGLLSSPFSYIPRARFQGITEVSPFPPDRSTTVPFFYKFPALSTRDFFLLFPFPSRFPLLDGECVVWRVNFFTSSPRPPVFPRDPISSHLTLFPLTPLFPCVWTPDWARGLFFYGFPATLLFPVWKFVLLLFFSLRIPPGFPLFLASFPQSRSRLSIPPSSPRAACPAYIRFTSSSIASFPSLLVRVLGLFFSHIFFSVPGGDLWYRVH